MSQKLNEVRDTQIQDPLDDMRHGRWGRFVTGGLGVPDYLEEDKVEDEKC